MLLFSLSSLNSFAGDHKGFKEDMEQMLNLTEEQKGQIDEIEQRYRSLLREKRSEKLSREEMRQLFVESHEKMREEIRAVLTPEQQEIAEQQVKKQKEKRMARHLKRLAKDLDLTKDIEEHENEE